QREPRLDRIARGDLRAIRKREREPSERFLPRPERRCAAGLPAPSPGDARPALDRERHELAGEPGLADAWLARDQRDPATSTGELAQAAVERRELAFPADQHRCILAEVRAG